MSLITIITSTIACNTVLPFVGYGYMSLLGKTIGRKSPDEAGGIMVKYTHTDEWTRIQAKTSFDHNLANTMIIPWLVLLPPFGIIATVANSTMGTINWVRFC
jgi:hypothetical protein